MCFQVIFGKAISLRSKTIILHIFKAYYFNRWTNFSQISLETSVELRRIKLLRIKLLRFLDSQFWNWFLTHHLIQCFNHIGAEKYIVLFTSILFCSPERSISLFKNFRLNIKRSLRILFWSLWNGSLFKFGSL